MLQQKASKTQCVAGGNVSSGQMSSPLGSPRSADILSDKELEEIIRFINGVDSAVAASASAGGSLTKQKTSKHKSKKVTCEFLLLKMCLIE
jgi:hypothetical protein